MKYKVTLEVEVTGDADFDDVEEMLQFELRYNGQASMNNPFYQEDSDCDWEVTDFFMREL